MIYGGDGLDTTIVERIDMDYGDCKYFIHTYKGMPYKIREFMGKKNKDGKLDKFCFATARVNLKN